MCGLLPGPGNRDQPKHTTCSGPRCSEHPTYSAFCSVFGASCLSLQRLPSGLGFGTTARLAPQEEPSGFRRNLGTWNVARRIRGKKQPLSSVGLHALRDEHIRTIELVHALRLSEQVKRNEDRFPPDFAFQLTLAEKTEVVANCGHLGRLR
jgi:hypothetical protein